MKQHETRLSVRFNEVDSFDVVWHGNFIEYFEIGRLDLCSGFALSPEDMRGIGLYAPVVDIKCRLRAPARYNDSIIVKTSVVPSEKALLTFTYKLLREPDMTLLAEGETTHVLLTLADKMLYQIPDELTARIEKMLAYLNAE